jgi:virginiamycin A acetyltransferase
MPGVNTGDGAIVYSRFVVVSDESAHSVVGGNPARVLKQRFPDDVVSALREPPALRRSRP